MTLGSPSSPCKTINYAWNTRANGPTIEGGEDIICFTEVCMTENAIAPGVSGSGVFVKTASESEQYDFEFPLNPTILSEWDVDKDDISIIDGSVNNLHMFIDIGTFWGHLVHLTQVLCILVI